MEFLDGQELRAVLDHQPEQPIPRLIRIFSQCAVALDFAHAQGVVHRDLKPDNIFLVNRDGIDHVKLLDFGSVKFTKGQDRGQKLTVMGTTIGSPHYMSPEQAKGSANLDHRADVWALGVILYEATVGTVPFHAGNAPQILFKILGEEVNPPSFANATLPEALDDIIARALAKPLERRYSSVGAFADGLGAGFGLPGTHVEWAQWTAADIASRMGQAKPQRPLSIAPQPLAPQLHAMNAPAAKPQQAQPWHQAETQPLPTNSSPDLGPMTLPVRNSPVALFVVLGLLVLALVVVVVFAMKS